jgi:hypothetical protein
MFLTLMLRVLIVLVLSVLLLHVKLLGLVPCKHLGELVLLGEQVGDLDIVDAGVDCQRVLSVLLCLVCLLNLVVLGNFLVNFVLDPSFTLLHFRVHN